MASADKAKLARLQSSDAATVTRALRDIKNELIGNPHKKQSYGSAGAVEGIVASASNSSSSAVWAEAAAALASLALGVPETAQQLQACEGVALLLRFMRESSEPRTIEHTGRALHIVLKVSNHSTSVQDMLAIVACQQWGM